MIVVIVTLVFLVIIWGTFLWYLVKYGEYVKESPIKVAAKKYKLDCTCTSELYKGAMIYITKEGEVTSELPLDNGEQMEINFTQFGDMFTHGAG